ncbi:acyltransferase 3 [Paenibacillus sp. J23TS9]|uniref:acyltransferase n=1 Tax=Paenibacillus sp. J23TS9 TaxID=2807193 RepID=UPI001B2D03DB|nr:acyltransferase [Paenibacillus sp. J23TS9]GIP30693.1 acyltransferase 3 [Paenibacillus sp. J23TS9]
MRKKERIYELDVFRSFAIMAVLTIHATSQTLVETKGTSLYIPFLFLNTFSSFAVPVFIFLSGFVLFYNYIDRPLNRGLIKSFYGKRLLYILVPYMVFTVFYFIFQLYRRDQLDMPFTQMLHEFGQDLAKGTAYTHLYYVIIMLQLYLIFPLLLGWFKKQPGIRPWIFPIGLILEWLYIYINKYGFHLPSQSYAGQHLHLGLPKGSIIITYLSYLFLGAGIGMYYDQFKKWIEVSLKGFKSGKGPIWVFIWILWIAIGVLHTAVWYRYNTVGSSLNTMDYELLRNVHALLSCIVLWHISYAIYYYGPRFARLALTSMGACSFGIFLLHPFLLYWYRYFINGGSTLKYAITIAGGWVVALGLSWIVVYLAFKYVKGSWLFFGSNPFQSKKKKAAEN